jgi:hypothetical protein
MREKVSLAMRKGFLRGIARLINPFASRISYPHKTDREALRSDWQKVGDDFRKVFYDKEDRTL